VGSGRRAPRRLRQAWGTDSKGTGEPGRPVTRLGSLLGAHPRPGGPDDRRWRPLPGRRRSRRPDGLGPLHTTPHAPNRFHRVRALTGFPTHLAGGPSDPCNTCTLLHPDLQLSSRCTVDFLPVLHPVIFFRQFFLWLFLAGTVPLLLTEIRVQNSRPNSVISKSYFGYRLRPISVIFGPQYSVFLL
jgi:hypothetical protein